MADRIRRWWTKRYALPGPNTPRAPLDVDHRDRAGRTPLHYAVGDDPVGLNYTAALKDPVLAAENVRIGHAFRIANTRRLLSAGADVNAADDVGFTPLHAAAQHDSVEVVRILLDAGADLEVTNGRGETPLYCAVRNTTAAAVPITGLLLDRGADPDAPLNSGSSPRRFVQRYPKAGITELFAALPRSDDHPAAAPDPGF